MTASSTFGARRLAGENWGFQFDAGQAPGQPLIQVKQPYPYHWTLQLLAWRYQRGTITPVAGTTPTPDSTTNISPATLTLQYGVDGANERVDFDYPRQGCSVSFSCAYANLILASTAAVITSPFVAGGSPPLLGGFITPGGVRSCDVASQPPTLTRQVTLNELLPIPWLDVPARARAYRIVACDANGPINEITATQLAANLAVVARDYGPTLVGGETLSIADGAGDGHLYPQRNLWVPLDPAAAALTITMVTAMSPFVATYRVQFLLDLG